MSATTPATDPAPAGPAAAPATIVLLPGLANDGEVWDGVRPALAAFEARGHRIVVETPHFGAVPGPRDGPQAGPPASLEAMADALLAAHAAAARPLVLVGHSMGGMVAMHAALRASGAAGVEIAALALLGTTARADTPELIRLRSEACALFAAGRAEEVLRANALFAFHPERQRDAGLVQRYLDLVLRAGAAQLIAQNRAVMARPDLRPRLAAIAVPTLVLVGEGDALTTPEHAREIAAAIAGARLEVLWGCGHMLTLEQPALVGSRLAAWLEGVMR